MIRGQTVNLFQSEPKLTTQITEAMLVVSPVKEEINRAVHSPLEYSSSSTGCLLITKYLKDILSSSKWIQPILLAAGVFSLTRLYFPARPCGQLRNWSQSSCDGKKAKKQTMHWQFWNILRSVVALELNDSRRTWTEFFPCSRYL